MMWPCLTTTGQARSCQSTWPAAQCATLDHPVCILSESPAEGGAGHGYGRLPGHWLGMCEAHTRGGAGLDFSRDVVAALLLALSPAGMLPPPATGSDSTTSSPRFLLHLTLPTSTPSPLCVPQCGHLS